MQALRHCLLRLAVACGAHGWVVANGGVSPDFRHLSTARIIKARLLFQISDNLQGPESNACVGAGNFHPCPEVSCVVTGAPQALFVLTLRLHPQVVTNVGGGAASITSALGTFGVRARAGGGGDGGCGCGRTLVCIEVVRESETHSHTARSPIR